MRRRPIAAVGLLLLASCGGNAPAPAPVAAPAPIAPPPAPASPEEHASGTVRVNVSSLNVRRDASGSAPIIAHVRRGERLTLIAESGDWLRVKLNDGTSGWVSSQHVVRDGATATRAGRRGCPADSDYSFVTTPKPAFSEGGAHGMVVIEATVDVRGAVTATRVVSNETHDGDLARLAEREIRGATFAPPIRNCVPRAFFFTYKRAF